MERRFEFALEPAKVLRKPCFFDLKLDVYQFDSAMTNRPRKLSKLRDYLLVLAPVLGFFVLAFHVDDPVRVVLAVLMTVLMIGGGIGVLVLVARFLLR